MAEVQGINLGQGICKMPVPDTVLEKARQAVAEGKNLYSPAQGQEVLREALAKRLQTFNKIDCSAENILITSGATGAFESVCHAFLEPGDEVISFTPYYPYHHNTLQRMNTIIHYIPLQAPNWEFDADQIEAKITRKTKFILLNTPNNPTGKVFSRDELQKIATICQKHDLLCVTDEVYEYMTYDNYEHVSMASLSGMQDRTITMGAYSKTFAITGWRIGYLVAPESIFLALRSMSDQVYICAPTPMQIAVAEGIQKLPDQYYADLKADYSRKRSILAEALSAAGLPPYVPQGAYYILADIREKFPERTADDAIYDLIQKTRVGAVPASDFVGEEAKTAPEEGYFFRFCYSVPDEELHQAGEYLSRW